MKMHATPAHSAKPIFYRILYALSLVIGRMTTGLLATLLAGSAAAALPAATPAQKEAAAEKTQLAADEATRQKQELAASMDQVAARWRARATAAGWDVHPATPVMPVPGIAASAMQAGGQLGATAATTPLRSEKLGTAPPSADVKDPAKKGK